MPVSSDFLFRLLPAVLGLILVGFAIYRLSGVGGTYFHVATSWVVGLFVLSVAVMFVFAAIANSVAHLEDFHIQVATSFVIGAIWLSTCSVSLITIYRKHSYRDEFLQFLKDKPLNLMSMWGLLGLLLIVAVWNSGIRDTSIGSHAVLLIAVTTYLIASIVLDMVMPIRANAKGELPRLPREAKFTMAFLAAAWIIIPSSVLMLDVILGAGFGFSKYNPYLWVIVVMFVAFVRTLSMIRLQTVIVDPEVETARREGFRAYDIPRGVYLIYDGKPDSALSLFSELVTLPLRPDAKIPVSDDSASETLEFLIPRGLVVTREFPDSVRERYGLQVTPIIWLTESPGERRIAPTSLAVLTDSLVRFMESNHNSIILVEGIEYIITFNDFKKVQRSLDILNEAAWVTKARLVIAAHPDAFDRKERALLERDRIVLRGEPGISELKRESKVAAAAT